jgi:hypothetical protein
MGHAGNTHPCALGGRHPTAMDGGRAAIAGANCGHAGRRSHPEPSRPTPSADRQRGRVGAIFWRGEPRVQVSISIRQTRRLSSVDVLVVPLLRDNDLDHHAAWALCKSGDERAVAPLTVGAGRWVGRSWMGPSAATDGRRRARMDAYYRRVPANRVTPISRRAIR